MENWREHFRPASFRGVPFFIKTSSLSTGRRIALHEFPNKETSFPEDLGQLPRVFQVEGHVLGDNYLQIKTDLINAINEKGFGELIHPYYGTLQVQAGTLSITENTMAGGIANFSMQFYRANDSLFPTETVDIASATETKTQNSIKNAVASFNSIFDITAQPTYALRSARKKIQDTTEFLASLTKGVEIVSKNAVDLSLELAGINSDIDNLIAFPEKLSERFNTSMTLLRDSILNSSDKVDALLNFRTFDRADSIIKGTSKVSVTEKRNIDSLNFLIKKIALSNAVAATLEEDFSNIVDATARREQLRDWIEDQTELSTNDEDYQSLLDLNSVLVMFVPNTEAVLPNIKNLGLSQTTNTLALSYSIYGNIDSEQDLIVRNKITNPAFIEAQSTIEYIENV